jgi:hypothetical protein
MTKSATILKKNCERSGYAISSKRFPYRLLVALDKQCLMRFNIKEMVWFALQERKDTRTHIPLYNGKQAQVQPQALARETTVLVRGCPL